MYKMIRVIPEASPKRYELKQKYPTVPTKEFITIKTSGSSSFTIHAGPSQRKIYQGATQGDKIVSFYFDGANAVFTCQRRIFLFGPSSPKSPTKGWHLIKTFPAH